MIITCNVNQYFQITLMYLKCTLLHEIRDVNVSRKLHVTTYKITDRELKAPCRTQSPQFLKHKKQDFAKTDTLLKKLWFPCCPES